MAIDVNSQPIQMNMEPYKKILNTEHKFVTLYAINSAQNIFIHYSVQHLH